MAHSPSLTVYEVHRNIIARERKLLADNNVKARIKVDIITITRRTVIER